MSSNRSPAIPGLQRILESLRQSSSMEPFLLKRLVKQAGTHFQSSSTEYVCIVGFGSSLHKESGSVWAYPHRTSPCFPVSPRFEYHSRDIENMSSNCYRLRQRSRYAEYGSGPSWSHHLPLYVNIRKRDSNLRCCSTSSILMRVPIHCAQHKASFSDIRMCA